MSSFQKARLKGVEEIQQLYEIESVNGDLQSKKADLLESTDGTFGHTLPRRHYIEGS